MVQENKLDCYVFVRGQATDAEDEGVQGVYLVQAEVPAGAAVGEVGVFTGAQKMAAADAALDSFHQHQGIAMLEDFYVDVFLDTGEVLDAEASQDIQVRTSYLGKLEESDLPLALLPLMHIAQKPVHSSPSP